MKQRYGEFEISVFDDKNYVVNRVGIGTKGKSQGQETHNLVGYYSDIAGAVKEVARLCADKTEDLKAWLAEYRKVQADIEEMLS